MSEKNIMEKSYRILNNPRHQRSIICNELPPVGGGDSTATHRHLPPLKKWYKYLKIRLKCQKSKKMELRKKEHTLISSNRQMSFFNFITAELYNFTNFMN